MSKITRQLCNWSLKGISTNDMESALKSFLGNSVEGFSAANVSRLKNIWLNEFNDWNKRSLADKNYCYIWGDGIHFNLRFEEERLCILVMPGVKEDGTKELISIDSGYRESTDSWSCFLRNMKARGLISPKLFIGDGALGFWRAVKDVFPESRWQRCWSIKLPIFQIKCLKKYSLQQKI